jgi:sugar/nucleoside kinase (ribokinase family)
VGFVAVVGHTARDVVDGAPPRPGGVPLFAARALRALGEPGLVVTRCAEEDRALLGPLHAVGLPVVWRPEPVTPAFHLTNDGDRRDLRIEALGSAWTLDDVRTWLGAAVSDAGWVHAGPLWRGDFEADALRELARGRRLSFDGQGLVRPGELGPVRHDCELDTSVLEAVDVLHLAEDEIDALRLGLDERSLRTLGVPEIIVTLGSRGCVVYADDLAELVPARALAGVDPTGAGDAFTAAYVASRLAGQSPVSSAHRATALVHGLLSGRVPIP